MAQQPDLYTVLSDGKEEDEFETFITRGFEEPGQQAIEKLLSRSSMKPADWHSIARFVVAQDLRTPLHFLEWMPQFKKHMGKAFKETIRKYEAMDQIVAEEYATTERPAENYLGNALRISID